MSEVPLSCSPICNSPTVVLGGSLEIEETYLDRCPAKTEPIRRVEGILPDSQDQDLAVTVLRDIFARHQYGTKHLARV